MIKLYLILSCFSLFLVLISSNFTLVEAQIIPITISDTMDDVIFDGKWSFTQEWKASALEEIRTETGYIYVRTAHQDEFVYVMLDSVYDVTPNNDDYAVVCFDSRINNSSKNNDAGYCFKINMNENQADTLLWNEEKHEFEKINNNSNLVSIGAISDENDRYSPIPHPSYEFKIPLELLNRYDKYGFFVGVFNSNNNESYTWPENVDVDLSFELPPPQSWGLLVSPDKSLPEYDLPIMIFVFTITFMILISSKKTNLSFLKNSI